MLTIIHRHKCDICESIQDVEFSYVAVHQPAPWPMLPQGWRLVDGSEVCQRHNVIVTDKEATVFGAADTEDKVNEQSNNEEPGRQDVQARSRPNKKS